MSKIGIRLFFIPYRSNSGRNGFQAHYHFIEA